MIKLLNTNSENIWHKAEGGHIMYYGTNPLFLDKNRPRKVVFYGRVSTEHEAQLSALENQMQWYEDTAKRFPNWEVVGRYIDEGLTGRGY